MVQSACINGAMSQQGVPLAVDTAQEIFLHCPFILYHASCHLFIALRQDCHALQAPHAV
jgi:hypothetical protein